MTEQNNAPKTFYPKKLSAKQIVPELKKFMREQSSKGGKLENDGDITHLYKMFGLVSSVETGEGDYGPWIKFVGKHEALNLYGDYYASTAAFLPEPLPGMLMSALESNDTVEYAVEVSIKRRDDLAIGYEFLPSPLIEVSENDPLASLRAKALGHADKSQVMLENKAEKTVDKKSK